MISDYSDFYQWMILELPGCPKPVMLQHLKRAFREFAFKTESWWEELPKTNLVANQQLYGLLPTYDALIKRINWVRISDGQQSASHYELKDEFQLKWKDDYIPSSSTADGLQVKVTMYPDYDNDVIDENYFTRWGDAIMAQAMYTLMLMPGHAWTNGDKAQIYNRDYQEMFNDAVRERVIQYKGGTPQINLTGPTRRFA